MHPFGGTPICPRCSKAVYAAEQVSLARPRVGLCRLVLTFTTRFTGDGPRQKGAFFLPSDFGVRCQPVLLRSYIIKYVTSPVFQQAVLSGAQPCLACTNCGVRLDSFRLLEHDEMVRVLLILSIPHY